MKFLILAILSSLCAIAFAGFSLVVSFNWLNWIYCGFWVVFAFINFLTFKDL